VPYRARPSFTVEVKRTNKRVPLTVTTVDSSLSERHRLADQLLFGARSVPVNPPTRPGGGGPAIRAPEPTSDRPAAEAVPPKAPAEAGDVQRLTGRVLPDLLGETRAEERLRQDLEERAARLRAVQGARKTRPSVEPMWADTPVGDDPDPAREAVLDLTPAAMTTAITSGRCLRRTVWKSVISISQRRRGSRPAQSSPSNSDCMAVSRARRARAPGPWRRSAAPATGPPAARDTGGPKPI
jgi:hypothetical protein